VLLVGITVISEFKERIALRVSTKERRQIELVIQKGQFKHMSQVIRIALDEFLSRQDNNR